ncbi:MAG: cache domain-containing protein, partial [Thermotogaceae bacterium]|nr:cache domain-containing protein [Thermotogaceae bacterium]
MKKSLTFKLGITLFIALVAVISLIVFTVTYENMKILKSNIRLQMKSLGKVAVETVKQHDETIKSFERQMMESKREEIKVVVESALNVVEHYYKLYQDNAMTEEEAKERAKQALASMS